MKKGLSACAVGVWMLRGLGACQSSPLPADTASNETPVRPVGTTPCRPGRAGCPCDSQDVPVGCGEVAQQSGDYVTCAMGQSLCANGRWGACLGTTFVTKSLFASTASAGAVRFLSSSFGCLDAGGTLNDPCDPTCTYVSSTVSDVDASHGDSVATTFTQVFSSNCDSEVNDAVASGTHVQWQALDWSAIVPPTSSSVFAIQTGDLSADAAGPVWSPSAPLTLATATASTFGTVQEATIDTGSTGLLNVQMPPIPSKNDLLLTVTINPTSDGTMTPTLQQWLVKSVCVATE
jgi:hypothetical protein